MTPVDDVESDVVFTHLAIWLGGELHQGMQRELQGRDFLRQQAVFLSNAHLKHKQVPIVEGSKTLAIQNEVWYVRLS